MCIITMNMYTGMKSAHQKPASMSPVTLEKWCHYINTCQLYAREKRRTRCICGRLCPWQGELERLHVQDRQTDRHRLFDPGA